MGALPQHPYSIPYHFTIDEADTWLNSQLDNPVLQSYLTAPQLRPAGIEVDDGYAQIIVWVDASGIVHVIDATNMAVTQHVNDAQYQSPNSSFVQNAIDEVSKLVGGVADWAKIGIGIAVILWSWKYL